MTCQRTTLAVLVLGFALAGPAVAQEEQQEYSAAMAEMMEVYAQAGMPGEAHALLGRMSGTWDFEVKFWMDPAGEPEVMQGVSKIEMAMDGRWSIEKVESDFMGMPFHGTGITGYNNATEMYQSVWFDNTSTTLYTYTGWANESGDGITMTGEFEDPVTGEMVKQKSVLKLIGGDQMHAESYETRGGVEMKTMELHYRRKM